MLMNSTYWIQGAIALIVIIGGFFLFRSVPPTTPINSLNSTNQPTPINTTSITPLPKVVQATLKTSKGDIELELDGPVAPLTVGNFVALAQKNFYDHTLFHRIIPDFMIQGGDPLTKDPANKARFGTGDPGYKFQDEINPNKLVRGAIAMANSGPNTNGSQFFIITAEATPWLDGKHTYFGKVMSGMDVVDAIVKVDRDANDLPLEPVVIQSVTIKD